MMNDRIGYIMHAVILDAWTENVGGDLQHYLDSKPNWDDIEWQAWDIAASYFETKGNSNDQHRNKEHNQQKTNQLVFNRDAMQYWILVHAMNYRMVDVVVDGLTFWIPVFQACGKHKYSSYLSKFLFRLKHYPAPLRATVLNCWLCNPSGHTNKFHPVDWLVELMNLYTKVSRCIL